jgi:serine/threonine protein kinase
MSLTSGRRLGVANGEDTSFVGDPGASGAAVPGAVELTGGTVNGRYRLTGAASQWAVGTAHPAVDLLDHELVVLVYPSVPVGREMDFYRRAAGEVERTRALRGTSLVCMRDCGALANGRPYFVMQRVQAHSVQKVVAEHGPISVEMAMHLVDQIMLLTLRAHSFGVVLGDIRPANIFVTETRHPDGRRYLAPTVVDTGYARGLFDGLIALPEPPSAYRSPQRRRGESATPADDIYALGALLSFLVTGRAPRMSTGDALDPAAWGPSRIRPDLRISPLVDRIVLRCLEPRPEARWRDVRTMQEAAEALRQVLTLPPAARALLDELLASQVSGAEAVGTLAGLGTGPRGNSDVPTRQILPEGDASLDGDGPRHRATAPFDPRDVAAALLPKPEPAGGEGTRPLSTEQLRRLLRVIDSPDLPESPEAEPLGARPLDPPRFSLVTSDPELRAAPAVEAPRPSAELRVAAPEPPVVSVPPVVSAPPARTPTGSHRRVQTGPMGSREPASERAEAPGEPRPVSLTMRVGGGGTRIEGTLEPPEATGRITGNLPALRTLPPASAHPAVSEATNEDPRAGDAGARRPVGALPMDVFGGRPLDLPAELNPIPPAAEPEDPRARTRSAQWRYGLVLGATVACLGAAAFFLVARRNPGPARVEAVAPESGYLPSAAVAPAVSGPPLEQAPPAVVKAAPPSAAPAPVAPVAPVAPRARRGGRCARGRARNRAGRESEPGRRARGHRARVGARPAGADGRGAVRCDALRPRAPPAEARHQHAAAPRSPRVHDAGGLRRGRRVGHPHVRPGETLRTPRGPPDRPGREPAADAEGGCARPRRARPRGRAAGAEHAVLRGRRWWGLISCARAR